MKIKRFLLSSIGVFLSICSVSTWADDFVSNLTIQENQPGFCSADGDIQETSNTGFSGDGYVNVVNQSHTQVVWRVEVQSGGTYQFTFKYANGSSNAREANLIIDQHTQTLMQNATGGWDIWAQKTISLYLTPGTHTVRLRAVSPSGLANIDYLNIAGGGVKAANCGAIAPHPQWANSFVSGCDNGATSGLSASRIYYVTPNGSASNDGSSFNAPLDLITAINRVQAGQMVLLQSGTYTIPYQPGDKNTLNISRSGQQGAPIYVVAANCGRAVFDFSFPEDAWVQDSYGIYLTGNYWYFKGIEVTRAGYQGVYVTGEHNTFENSAFHHNRNTGFEVNKGGAYTTVINSDAYRNYDVKKNGSMADGFGPKQTQGPGNRFIGCRAWENSDDGFDTYDSPQPVEISDSWAFRNGINYWNDSQFSGNGNGFKLGGNHAVQNNQITGSVAFDNVAKGFDQNNNQGGMTVINNTAYRNGINYGFGGDLQTGQQNYFRNNISLSGSVDIANANASFNSWDSGPSVSGADFISLDTDFATAERLPDGQLPFIPLLRLTPSAALIDAGSSQGLDFLGNAPDLGAFERE